ncbi:LacI family DNA-binding transcriptional regulator [Angustibacter sp. McL0619]|uniref:LacI family DNA-binding transcriptional regulator n=1 Tax=Angustibacter sp. McL0619 TaxID=3415676 RepID=UPI003CFAF747
MSETVSVKDVASRAGVSLGTVSNVLNRPDRVTEATRARVHAAIDELGYVRNEAARQLRAGRSRTIGLLVLDVANPFFTDLAAGVEIAADANNLGVMLCNSRESESREDKYLSMLQEQRVFGILITPMSARSKNISRIARSGTPVVMVDRPSSSNFCSVSVDDVSGGRQAVAHLIACGHTRIGFVGGPSSIGQVEDRLAGARLAMEQAGLNPKDLAVLETPGLNVAAGRAAGDQLLTRGARRPTAVFCANDLLALGMLQSMTANRLAVPDDMAIVGYDDIDFAAAAAVALTSIRQPTTQLGQAAAELLIEEVRAPKTHGHRQVIFAPELVVRSSTQGGASGGQAVAG